MSQPATSGHRRGGGHSGGPVLSVEPLAIIPQAGEVVRGRSEVDEAAVTGLVLPVLKGPGDSVLAGSRNGAETLEIAVQENANQEAADREAAGKAGEVARAGLFGPFLHPWSRRLVAVGVAAILAGLIWLVWTGRPITPLGVLYLVIGVFPPGLLLVWPSQRFALQSWLRRHGLVCRDLAQLRLLRRSRRFIFGQAGSLSQGQLRVVSLQPAPDVKPGDFITLAASAHQMVEDVWGRAILAFAISHRIRLRPSEKVLVTPGAGLSAVIDGRTVLVGRRTWLEEQGIDVSILDTAIQEHLRLGRQILLVGVAAPEPVCLGVIALADPPKAGAQDLVKTLKQSGVETLLVAGGDPVATATLSGLLGVDRSVDAVEASRFDTRGTVAVGRRNDRALLTRYERSIAIGDVAVTHVPETIFGIRREDPRHVLDFIMLAQTLQRRLPLTLLLVWLTGWPVASAGLGLITMTPQLAAYCLCIGIVMAVFLAQLLRLVGSLANDEVEN